MKTYGKLALAALALLSLPLHAADKPTQDEVSKVMNYYRDGSEVILVESKICTEVEKSGDNKNECSDTIEQPVALNKSGYMWMNFMVPGNEPATLLVQFKYKGRALDSDELHLSNAIRYRTWKRLQTSKSGDWVVNIEQETNDGYIPVAKLEYTVADREADTE